MANVEKFEIQTNARNQMIDITKYVEMAVKKSGVKNGICVIHIPHTTAGVTINENADPDVCDDIIFHLNTLIPNLKTFKHFERNSDSHLKSSIIGCSQTVIIENGELLLGRWQGIYFCEFDGERHRNFFVKIIEG